MRIGIGIQWNKNENLIPIPVIGFSVELILKSVLTCLVSHWNGMQYNYFDKNTLHLCNIKIIFVIYRTNENDKIQCRIIFSS